MPSLYYHYGSKEGILFALLDVAMDDLQTRIDECLEDAGDDNRIRFENFVTTVALHNTHRRDLAMLHDEYRFLGPTLRGRYLLGAPSSSARWKTCSTLELRTGPSTTRTRIGPPVSCSECSEEFSTGTERVAPSHRPRSLNATSRVLLD